MSDQLRTDLEQLYASIEEGWCKYRITNKNLIRYGAGGGCLGDKMIGVVRTNNNINEDSFGLSAAKRYDDMAEALGFDRPNGRTNSLTNLGVKLTSWNDYEATWDMVKERVKDAIGKL